MGWKVVEPMVYDGITLYKCAMCGEWMQYIDHIKTHAGYHENVHNVDFMVEYMWAHDFSTIMVGKVVKPFVCAWCMMMDIGFDENTIKSMANTIGMSEL